MPEKPRESRRHQVRRLREFLERHRSPRLTVFLMVTAVGAFGLLGSFLLLHLGLRWPALRWPLVVLLAYGLFLLLLRWWQASERARGTRAPFLITLAIFLLAGLWMGWVRPEAVSLRDFLSSLG
jgi:hypothetical protein